MTSYLWIATLSIFVISLITRCLPLTMGPWMKRHPWIRTFGISLLPPILILLIAHSIGDHPMLSYPYGIPTFIGIAATIAIHLRFRNMLLSIMTGFVSYQTMLYVF